MARLSFRGVAIPALLTLCTAATAQVTTASLQIGGNGALGCQGSDDPPTLSGGVLASATYDFSYDQASRRLALTVRNTSPVVAGEANPLLTKLYLNLPPGAVTAATLVGQVGAAGRAPEFRLEFGNRGAGCFGSFELELREVRSGLHGIANDQATRTGGPPGSAAIGPVTFTIELSGPGVDNINARALAYGFSDNHPRVPVNAAAKFQAGGPAAEASGFIGSVTRPADCATSMWLIGEPRLGNEVTFCRDGLRLCHDCLWISLHPGPTEIPALGVTVPIGFPLLAVIDTGVFTGQPLCITYRIPNDPNLLGQRLYHVLATFDESNGRDGIPAFSFGDVFVIRLF